jgi:hypothetical protein
LRLFAFAPVPQAPPTGFAVENKLTAKKVRPSGLAGYHPAKGFPTVQWPPHPVCLKPPQRIPQAFRNSAMSLFTRSSSQGILPAVHRAAVLFCSLLIAHSIRQQNIMNSLSLQNCNQKTSCNQKRQEGAGSGKRVEARKKRGGRIFCPEVRGGNTGGTTISVRRGANTVTAEVCLWDLIQVLDVQSCMQH